MPQKCAFRSHGVHCPVQCDPRCAAGYKMKFSAAVCDVIGVVHGSTGALCANHRQLDRCSLRCTEACIADSGTVIDYGQGNAPGIGRSMRHLMQELTADHCFFAGKPATLAYKKDQPNGETSARICSVCQKFCRAAEQETVRNNVDGSAAAAMKTVAAVEPDATLPALQSVEAYTAVAQTLLKDRAKRINDRGKTQLLRHVSACVVQYKQRGSRGIVYYCCTLTLVSLTGLPCIEHHRPGLRWPRVISTTWTSCARTVILTP